MFDRARSVRYNERLMGEERLMKNFFASAAIAALLTTGVASAEAVKGAWTGYITDTHCGKDGGNSRHTADCVRKCMKGGSKAQIVNDADGKIYDLDSFDKVKELVGTKVTIEGSLDSQTNTITVDKAAKTAK